MPRFKDALPNNYLSRYQIQNDYLFEKYSIEIMQKNMLDELKDGKISTRKIINKPWYNIQYIPEYTTAFAYIGPHFELRDEFIKDDKNNANKSI